MKTKTIEIDCFVVFWRYTQKAISLMVGKKLHLSVGMQPIELGFGEILMENYKIIKRVVYHKDSSFLNITKSTYDNCIFI